MSDPPPPRWLADDVNFLASLGDLDRGLGGHADARAEQPAALPPPAQDAPSPPVRPAGSRPPVRVINAARALDPTHLLDTTPPPRVSRTPAPPPPSVAPPLAFARPAPVAPRPHRPLLDLFPESALVPDVPPPLAAPPIAAMPPPPQAATHRPSRPEAAPPPSQVQPLTYEHFYGLREKAFSLSTDPRFEYPSASHERAGEELLAAIRSRSGPVLLTGAMGMGKTTLSRSLMGQIDRRTVTSLVLEPFQSLDELLKTMLVDFGVVSREDIAGASHLTRDVLLSTLNSFLDSLTRLQASALLLIDEAQNVPVPVLGDLAGMLSSGAAARMLQVVIVGQPSLRTMLKQGDLRPFNATIARRAVLEPLGPDEVSGYIRHRLAVAGGGSRIQFDDTAISRLFEVSEGSPRIVNLLCDRALTRGQAASAGVIDAGLIDEAAGDLDLVAPRRAPGALESLATAAIFVLLFLSGAAAAVYVSRDAVSRTILQWENVPLPPGGPIRRLPMPIAPIPPSGDEPTG